MLKVDPLDRAKLIDPLYRTSGRFWILIAFLLIVIGWGVFMYLRQLLLGLGVTGMQRPVYWGIYMVNFIFFIGISHAGTLISAILRVTGAEWRRSITRIAEAITVVALMVGSLQILFDMGRPDRLLFVFRHGRLQSPLLWDAVSVTAYFLGSITYLYLPLIPDVAILRDNAPEECPVWRLRLYNILALGWRGNKTQWVRLEKAIAIMAVLIIPIAVSVHTIISWILATTVQPGWSSTIFGPYFVVGAIFSGIGALFVAMTVIRQARGLEDYITSRQFKNLGLIFILMSAVWMYFTYAEHLTLAAGQEVNEFPVLASKLWGEFALGFWAMVIMMLVAFWIMVAPLLIPDSARKVRIFQPRFAFASIAIVGLISYVLIAEPNLPATAGLGDSLVLRTFLLLLLAVNLLIIGLVAALWFKSRPILATLAAAFLVLVGMWLERWNIIIPTLTHPYLVDFATYTPTITEISITAGSLALFILLFVLFFKLFPVVSIWEVAEGRVIEAENTKVSYPMPVPSSEPRRRWGFKK